MTDPPNDSSSGGNRLDELAEEFVQRHQRGERPSLSEYTERHPELADEIRELFPALALMQNVRPEPGAATGPYEGGRGGTGALERLGDYRVLREVGRGGMGIVYEAEQESLGRHVALKVLPAHALLDAGRLQRFRREAKAAARLHHTNIVPVFGVGEQDGLHYYVMQFIHGLGLDEVLVELKHFRQGAPVTSADPEPTRNRSGSVGVLTAADMAQSLLAGKGAVIGPEAAAPGEQSVGRPATSATSVSPSSAVHLPGQAESGSPSDAGRDYWRSVARISLQVAEALAYAHGQAVLHRDIKPSNLLLDAQGTVWVTDFGLAKAMAGSGERPGEDDLTHTGDIVGTLRYMAPERFDGRSDARSDVYSLGLTLYEMLVFRPAFQERDRARLVQQVMHGEPPRPRTLNRAIPRDLETIVLKMIAADPAQRYRTAGELAEDLKRFVEDRPIRARRVSRVERLWRWCRRNPAMAGLLAALALALVGGLAGVTWKWREAEQARRDERTALDAAQEARRQAEDRAEENRRIVASLSTVNRLLASGRQHAGGGEWAAADADFTRATQLLPDSDLAWYERGQLYYRLRLWEAAAADLARSHQLQEPVAPRDVFVHAVLRLYVGDAEGYRRYGRRLPELFTDTSVLGGQRNEVVRACNLVPGDGINRPWPIQLAQEALADNPQAVWNLFALGGAHFRAREYHHAVQRLRESLAVQPDWGSHGTTHAFLAMTYHRLGQGEEAREALGHATTRLTTLRQGASEEPGASPPLMAVEWLEFLVIYREAKTLIEGAPPPDDPQDHIVRARAWVVLGQNEQAAAAYARAVALKPDDPRIRLQGVRVYTDLGRWDKADSEYAQATKLRTNDPQFHLDAFHLFASLKRWDRAEAAYARAAALKPNDPEIRLEGFQFYADLEQWDKARAEHEKAVRSEPEDTNLWLACFRYHTDRSQWEKADAELKRLRARRPGDAKLARAAAELFAQQKQWQRAADAAAASLALEPNQADVWGRKGDWHYHLRQWDRAVDALTEAVNRKPDNADFWKSRATNYAELERWDRAAADYARAVERTPDDLNLRYEHALACLAAGQTAGYRKACIHMLEYVQNREELWDPEMVLRTCTLGPGALAEPGQLIPWIKRLARFLGDRPEDVPRLEGRARYRIGEFQAAVERLKEGGNEDLLDCFFLAMAHHRLGHADEARRYLDKGTQLATPADNTPENVLSRKAVQLLRREAETLLKGKPSKPAK
jgi:serine/threonine protein kinase/Flp pilus assembly protein TadD